MNIYLVEFYFSWQHFPKKLLLEAGGAAEPLHAGEGGGGGSGEESAATSDGCAQDTGRGPRAASAEPGTDSGSEEPGTAPETTPETSPEKSADAPDDATPGGTRIYPMNLHFTPPPGVPLRGTY